MQNERRGGKTCGAPPEGGERLRRAEDELEQARVALEDAWAEAAALARERDAGMAELLRRTAQLREAEGRLRARDEGAASAAEMLRTRAPPPAPRDEAEAEALRSALEEVQVLAEELGEANAALQRSNDELDRTVARRTAALAEANARLRRAEERQRLILESATDYAIFATDAAGRVSSWNAGARNLLGWDAEEAIGMDSAAIFTPEDRAADAPGEEMRRALAEGRAAAERWHVRRDGSRFWGDGLLMRLRGEGDGFAGDGFLRVLRDRTERRRAEERQALLVGELNHRVKNTLALVLAIVDQTWRAGASAGDLTTLDFHEALRTRLRALARAHDLLVREDWAGADLSEVVAAAAAAHGGAGGRPLARREGGDRRRRDPSQRAAGAPCGRGLCRAGHGLPRTGHKCGQVRRAVGARGAGGGVLAARGRRAGPRTLLG